MRHGTARAGTVRQVKGRFGVAASVVIRASVASE